MRPVFVYVLNDPVTGTVRYCGQTVDPDDRLAKHLGKASKRKYHCARWVNSLLSKNLRPVMEILDVVPDNEADFWEREYIQNFRERGFDLTNFTKGGKGGATMLGRIRTPEQCAAISARQLGKKKSPATRAKMSTAFAGIPLTAEHVKNRTMAQRGKKRKTNTSGVVGVSLDKRLEKWCVRIGVARQYIYLGTFKNFEDAVFVRRLAEDKYFA